MNKRYIDFVPVQTTPKKSSKIVSSTHVKPVENLSARLTTVVKPAFSKTKTVAARKSTPVKPTQPKSVVSKPAAPKPTVIKPMPMKSAPVKPTSAKPVIPVLPKALAPAAPKFINTEKIDKRPLSDSIAPKKTLPSFQAPIASSDPKKAKKAKKSAKSAELLDRPKKGSAIGIIIAIILTIILGAAAGALAFLILPK